MARIRSDVVRGAWRVPLKRDAPSDRGAVGWEELLCLRVWRDWASASAALSYKSPGAFGGGRHDLRYRRQRRLQPPQFTESATFRTQIDAKRGGGVENAAARFGFRALLRLCGDSPTDAACSRTVILRAAEESWWPHPERSLRRTRSSQASFRMGSIKTLRQTSG
jgi:hypothetical protein